MRFKVAVLLSEFRYPADALWGVGRLLPTYTYDEVEAAVAALASEFEGSYFLSQSLAEEALGISLST